MARQSPSLAAVSWILFFTVLASQQEGCCSHLLKDPTGSLPASNSLRTLRQAVTPVPRIVDGEPVKKGRFPYMCNLKDNNHKHACGGVLISDRAVLTAAHCVVQNSYGRSLNLDLLVSVGAHGVQDDSSVDNVQDVKVTDIITHPNYQSDAIENGFDIAILILKEPAWAQPINLPIKGYHPGDRTMWALGWGQGDTVLQQVSLDTVDDATCRKSYPNMGESVICASGKGDTCEGDSGGPLLIADSPDRSVSNGKPKFDTLVALTSFGPMVCRGDDGIPSGFTLVEPFLDWMSGVIGNPNQGGREEPTPSQKPATPCEEEKRNERGESALYLASSYGEASLARTLIQEGAGVNCKSNDGQVALHAAASRDYVEVVKVLIGAGADVDAVDDDGKTPLIYAAEDSPNVIWELLDGGADVNKAAEDGTTPLIEATAYGNLEIMEALLDKGANIDQGSSDASPAIYWAISENELEALKLLISRGADVNVKTGDGFTPIVSAAYYGRAVMITVLIEAGADIDHVTNEGITAIFNAAADDYIEAVEALLDAGVNAEPDVSSRWPPLVSAAFDGSDDVVKALINYGVNVNAGIRRDSVASDNPYPKGTTALHVAAEQGHTSTVQILLDSGADKSIEDSDGRTPLDLVPTGSTRLADLLG